jgi:hypothetical protein
MRAQIKVLNDAFAGKDPVGPGASTPFKFVLAGYETTRNNAWFNMVYKEKPTAIEQEAKRILKKGCKSTLNLYTIKLVDKPYGWARYPWQLADGVDGIVVGYSTLPKGGLYRYDEGDTATHEVGHWLGLFHTFEGTCDDEGDCVADTPPGKDPAVDCPNFWDSCQARPYQDAVHNFMNDTWDSCMYEFTPGQSERMDAMYQLFRKVQ